MNQVFLTGRFVKDPEIRQTTTNKAVATFTLAVDDGKGKDGEKKTVFQRCVAWEGLAEIINRYFQKGDPIIVRGKLQNRTYEKNGEKHYNTEVVVDWMEFQQGKVKVANARDIEPGGTFDELDDDAELPF